MVFFFYRVVSERKKYESEKIKLRGQTKMSENESSRSDNKNIQNKEGDEKEKLRELVRAVKHAKRERFFKGVVVPFWWFLKVLVLFFSLVFLQNDEAKKVEALQQKYSPIEDRNIREASGLVKSKLNSKSPAGKVFWTHNDSGDRARVFAIRVPEKDDDAKSSKKTRVVAEVTILNAGNRDWEDLALWQDHKTNQQKLCAGDIGSYRGEVVIYCFPEPKLSEMSGTYSNVSKPPSKEYFKVPFTEKIRLRYPSNEKHDAETLLVDPHTSQFLIVTKKSNNKGALYVSEPIDALSQNSKGSNELKFVRTIKLYGTSSGATGGDISWSGKKIVLKSYGRYVYEYTRQQFFDPKRDPNVRGLGEYDPSEALALENDAPDENEIWTLNEGSGSSLRRYRLR